jgi:nitrogen fixation NifU-like protein
VFGESEKSIRDKMSRVYSEATIEHVLHPWNMGAMSTADGYGKITGSCGDTMEIWLKVTNGVVTEATFLTDGCAATVASGNMVTELARGKSIPQAVKISQQDVLDGLGGLPADNRHCALLAANTLKEALKDYFVLKREPWKRAYRNN